MKTRNMVLPLLAGIAVLACGRTAPAALTIVSSSSASTMANQIIGPGITLVPGSATYTGDSAATGLFSNGLPTGLGIDAGLILTTGSAANAIGPNSAPGTSWTPGQPGDPQLTTLADAQTYDACILEFDFTVSAGSNLYFIYVFGSEEYPEYVGSGFSDVLGCFLDGTNIALVPGSSTRVSINTINAGTNSAYYRDNSTEPYPFDLQYDGLTTVLTAVASNLSGGTHHMKLAIADVGDSILDSGVFIQAGSFSTVPSVPEPSTLGLLGAAALGVLGCAWRRQVRQKWAETSRTNRP
jgi:hypothetical protein